MNREDTIEKLMTIGDFSRQDAEDYYDIFHCESISQRDKMCATLMLGFKNTCAKVNQFIKENESDIKRSWFFHSLAKGKGCGVVYFIVNKRTGLVKIGKSTNVKKRIKQLESCATQLGMPAQTLYCAIMIYAPYEKRYSELEKELHRRYAKHRKLGEWFKLDLNAVKEDLFNDYSTPLSINDMLIYMDTPDILDLPLPKIRDCSENDLAAYVTTMISDEFDISAKARAETTYGVSIRAIGDIYLRYRDCRLDEFVLSELQSKVFKDTQLYMCKTVR